MRRYKIANTFIETWINGNSSERSAVVNAFAGLPFYEAISIAILVGMVAEPKVAVNMVEAIAKRAGWVGHIVDLAVANGIGGGPGPEPETVTGKEEPGPGDHQ